MRKLFEIGGVVAAAILIAFGVTTIVMGFNGRSTVRDSLKQEQIVGTPDMTPAAIAASAKEAGLPASIDLPTVAVADKPINTGERARAFASYMRIHALEATGGLTYAQMPRYATDDGKGTNDPAQATKDPNGQPVSNPTRNVWVTETALSTALNMSFMAERLSLFSIIIGVALLLAGFGFAILAIGGALRNPETALTFLRRGAKTGHPTRVVPNA
ncbi:MAG TPA: hypothetical protein VGJ34_11845 [Gaiellaceae bacterium]|jgi:hypothetical protein